jgi:hypothetical protein
MAFLYVPDSNANAPNSAVIRARFRRASHVFSLGAALAVTLADAHASAQTPPADRPNMTSCPDDASERFEYLHANLKRTAEAGQTWYYSWLIGYGVVAAGSAVVVAAVDTRVDRIRWGVGGATTLVGIASTLFSRPASISEFRRLDSAATSKNDACENLSLVTAALERASADEKFARFWLWHVGNVLLNTGAGLIIGLTTNDWTSAALNIGAGIAIGEVQLFTIPTGATRTLATYPSGHLDAAFSPLRISASATQLELLTSFSF